MPAGTRHGGLMSVIDLADFLAVAVAVAGIDASVDMQGRHRGGSAVEASSCDAIVALPCAVPDIPHSSRITALPRETVEFIVVRNVYSSAGGGR